MKPEVRMQLTRQLEGMRFKPEGPNSRWLFIAGTTAELIAGVAFIAWSIRFTIEAVSANHLYWVGPLILFLGVLVLAHAGYLTFNRSINRRLRLLYQAVLDTGSTDAP